MFKKLTEGYVFKCNDHIKGTVGSRTAVLPDGKLLCCLWCDLGIRYVKLQVQDK